MQVLAKKDTILCRIDTDPSCRSTFRRTKSHDFHNVLENNVTKWLYELTTNLTLSPFLWGIRCAASQSAFSAFVTTQAGPSRRMTSFLKLPRRAVCVVDVNCSFKPWWSTKTRSPGEVETLNSNLTHKKKAYSKADSSMCFHDWKFRWFRSSPHDRWVLYKGRHELRKWRT